VDDETLALLRTSLEHVLTEDSDRDLATRLDDLGWAEAVADDPATAARVLFEVKGATLTSVDALAPHLAGVLADALDTADLRDAMVMVPTSLAPCHRAARDTAELAGVALGRLDPGRTIVTATIDDAGAIVVLAGPASPPPAAADLGGMDPDSGLARAALVIGGAARWSATRADAAWTAVITAGRIALAAELVGLAHRVVAGAVEYSGERFQYGRPIGSFQAVQHRLASAYALVVGAEAVVAEAAATGSSWVARVAKAAAGRAAEDACTQAQQTYGAIGFTWEHELHRCLRRVYLLDRLLGDWRGLEREIGTALAARREVPRIGVL
jgi:hypothetical protein